MARKLKTYLTSVGFFDLAVAAPSMKAALEAWGAKSNLFQQGFARETDDAQIVAAAMAKPGVVLKRPVGSSARFAEHPDLPKSLPLEDGDRRREPSRKPVAPQKAKAAGGPARDAGAAVIAFEREKARLEADRLKKEQAQARERERRENAVAKAQAALEAAKMRHEETLREIEAQRAALDKAADRESTRWEAERERLRAAIERARG